MNNLKCILFDCMETLIDITELLIARDYAWWAFNGSGVETYWESFPGFYQNYITAKEMLTQKYPEFNERDLFERLELATVLNMNTDKKDQIQEVTQKLYHNFWKTYISKTYVREEVKLVLAELATIYRIGVVSNFIVKGGIEELLQKHSINLYFDFVITSINEGWRKPHSYIYNEAIKQAAVSPQEILFIGDNYECDYLAPGKMGLRAILLDRDNNHPEVREKIADFYELRNLLIYAGGKSFAEEKQR